MEIGPIIAPPSIDGDGAPVPGDVLDARYHINGAWHGMDPPEVFQAVAVTPTTPNRSFFLPPTPPPVEPLVPAMIPAWKGKVVLREAGLLGEVDAAITAAGGRLQDAWVGASEWERNSEFLSELAVTLGLSAGAVDQMFRDADVTQS